ncbi:hypothetical protein K1719_010662 [Acacia pycnantha]|nr:hypothetical protein K1719_010662 [Acacia pycnantha]
MKRPHAGDDEKMKKLKLAGVDEWSDDWASRNPGGSMDARTLAMMLVMTACVIKQWHKTAQDGRLWELICTKQ